MRAQAIEISWHNKTSVWSVGFAPSGSSFVTAGNDKTARVWRLVDDIYDLLLPAARQPGATSTGEKTPAVAAASRAVEWLCDLDGHSTTVNVARFAPCSTRIATGADRGELIVWALSRPGSACSMQAGKAVESWSQVFSLRGHQEDVLDVSWCSDGKRLVTASVDGAIMVWDVTNTKKPLATINTRKRIVQGVSIDPAGLLIASLGSDRALVVHSAITYNSVGVALTNDDTAKAHLFTSDMDCRSVFRRLAWSPDGSFLACPSGLQIQESSEGQKFAVHLFARGRWSAPALSCGGLTELPIAVSFCPTLFELRCSEKSAENPCFNLPYRMVFAVACVDAIFVYDTESFCRPIARISGVHFAEITDVSWASTGHCLLVSACDGCVSVVSLPADDVGNPLSDDKQPQWSVARRKPIERTEGTSLEPVTPVTVVVPRSKTGPPVNEAMPVVLGQPVDREGVREITVVAPRRKQQVERPTSLRPDISDEDPARKRLRMEE